MPTDYIARFGPEYGESHTAHAERLAVEVSRITASTPNDEQIKALAYLAMKGPSEMSTIYWYGDNTPHPTGERQTDGMIKKFLAGLPYDDQEKFRTYAEQFAPRKIDRIQYLLGER